MSGRPGFLGGLRQSDAPERDTDLGFGPDNLIGGTPLIRLGDPNGPRSGEFNTPPGFDPIWGTLGAPSAQDSSDWLGRDQEPEGLAIDVEVFGNGFQISGQIHTGQFERLSDWLNMQTGFIQVRDAWHVHLGLANAPDPDQRKGTLWVRVNQIILVAERSPVAQNRPGAPVVEKQKRKASIVTPGYSLLGSIYVHKYGSITQFLETPDPHFLPITDVNVRWLNDSAMIARFPFAMINREQLVTILDQSSLDSGDSANSPGIDAEDDIPLHRRSGAA
jgi:hypothetical protein